MTCCMGLTAAATVYGGRSGVVSCHHDARRVGTTDSHCLTRMSVLWGHIDHAVLHAVLIVIHLQRATHGSGAWGAPVP